MVNDTNENREKAKAFFWSRFCYRIDYIRECNINTNSSMRTYDLNPKFFKRIHYYNDLAYISLGASIEDNIVKRTKFDFNNKVINCFELYKENEADLLSKLDELADDELCIFIGAYRDIIK